MRFEKKVYPYLPYFIWFWWAYYYKLDKRALVLASSGEGFYHSNVPPRRLSASTTSPPRESRRHDLCCLRLLLDLRSHLLCCCLIEDPPIVASSWNEDILLARWRSRCRQHLPCGGPHIKGCVPSAKRSPYRFTPYSTPYVLSITFTLRVHSIQRSVSLHCAQAPTPHYVRHGTRFLTNRQIITLSWIGFNLITNYIIF